MRIPRQNHNNNSGLIVWRKSPGLTSFDSLGEIKRYLNTGKVGHTGSLDKFAEGLLLVLAGRALRLSKWFTLCDKQYEAIICFGNETDTLDPEGVIVSSAPLPSLEAFTQALMQFTGNIEQAPPAYSAIHIDGERASSLARRGCTVEMKKRPVIIYRMELLSWEPPFAKVFVHCSSGTYIRSLARDMALASGSRAHLTALLRTGVSGFKLEDAVSDLPLILPIDKTIFNKLDIPVIEVESNLVKNIINGKPLMQILKTLPFETLPAKKKSIAVFSDEKFIAMIENKNNNWTYGFVYESN